MLKTIGKKRLPRKPSKLLRFALESLKLREKSPKYRINMSKWFIRTPKFCMVCFAGATLSRVYRMKNNLLDELTYNTPPYRVAMALNYIHKNMVRSGLEWLNVPASSLTDVYIPPYEKGRRNFKKAIKTLADKLEANGY